ncbi:MAG: hypothetical protein HYX47_14735 [Burkholderiales bacterium]|nr:hypothetical protein [Burkholderiales bacterium]
MKTIAKTPWAAFALAGLAALSITGCNKPSDAGHDPTSSNTAVMGASGRGTQEPGSRSSTVQPGTGLNGGLGMNTPAPANGDTQNSMATEGSGNLTNKNSTGNSR